jgi:hypothetical protein
MNRTILIFIVGNFYLFTTFCATKCSGNTASLFLKKDRMFAFDIVVAGKGRVAY